MYDLTSSIHALFAVLLAIVFKTYYSNTIKIPDSSILKTIKIVQFIEITCLN